MATINYFIQSKNEAAGIYIRLREGSKIDAKAKTKYVINPSDWSSAKGQPKNLKNESFKKLHKQLTKLSSDLLDHFNTCSNRQKINTQWLKNFINPQEEDQKVPTKLLEYFDYYAKHKKNFITKSTYGRINVNKQLIERFQKATKSEYFISDIDADFKLKFLNYCMQQQYAQNTIARTIKYIKTLCYHARANGIETNYQLDSIKVKIEKVEKNFLTPEEIEKIQKVNLEHNYLMDARDWLVISCETGQRISDFMRFTKKNIRYEGKVPLIEFTQVKTSKIMAIPLSKKVREILETRGGDFPPRINDQKYNEFIRLVCKSAGLTQKVKGGKNDKVTHRKVRGLFPKYELVTSHIGRRSFATNNYGLIPTSLLINVTGHSTESMFLEYIGKTVTEKAIQLAEYFN